MVKKLPDGRIFVGREAVKAEAAEPPSNGADKAPAEVAKVEPTVEKAAPKKAAKKPTKKKK